MDTAEKPKAWLPGKPRKRNPAYDIWRKAQKEAGKPPEAAPPPEVLTLRCVKLARNATFVYCSGADGLVGVKVKRGLGPKLLKKGIRVRKDGETYVHAP